MNTYRPELDGIRAIAVLTVLASHVGIPGMAQAGPVGVTLFFVLSGYLITGLLTAERERTGRVSLRSFYERRVRRLLPALIATIGFTGLVALLMGRPGFPEQTLVTLLYGGNLALSAGFDMGYLAQTWSLALEEQFYLVFPALFLFVRERRLAWLLAGAAALSIALRFLVGAETSQTYARPDLRADAILVGCFLALRPWRAPRWAGLIAAGAAVAVGLWGGGNVAVTLTIATFASVVIVASAERLPFLANRLLVRIGVISYGLYLWHYAIGRVAEETWAPSPARITLVLAGSFALALISERFVERPFRLRRREPGSSGGVARAEAVVVDPERRGLGLLEQEA